MASKAFFSFEQCVEDYTKAGTDARRGAEAFEDGAELDVNIPADKAELKGIVAFFRKAADGIERDGGLKRR